MTKQLVCLISTNDKTPEQVAKQACVALTHFTATKMGLKRCKKCGEYCGETIDDGEELEVDCICNGITCTRCKVTKIHRPISNHFDETDNKIWHTPHFLTVCPKCRVVRDL